MSISLIPHLLQLDVYSHGLRVSRFTDSVRRYLVEFCKRYAQYGMVPTGRGSFESRIVKVYAAATKPRDEYFFHRHSLNDLLAFFKYCAIEEDRIKRVDHAMYTPAVADFVWADPNRKPFDYQEEAITFFLKPEPVSKILTLQTGKGKSLTALATMHRLQVRTVLIIKSMYMDQWVKDAIPTLGLKKGDIVTVNGAKAMKDLITLAKEDDDFNPKFIIISNTTYRMFIRSYLDLPGADLGYGCKPWEFFETVKAGLRLIDEVHMDFHLNFIIDTLTHCPKTISLSATLVSDDRFMNDMYGLVFPPECHAPMPDHDRYIDVITMLYRFDDPTQIRFTNAMKQYSQVKFEQSIMKHRRVLKKYVEMIVELSYHQWFVEREPGQKLAIFCGMKEMVEHVVAAAEIKYPQLKVRRFVDVDPDSHLEEADIIVTTLQSCGTAKDIKGLKVVINTIALSSMQANQQLVGRLRRLQGWPDVTPKFIYLGDRGNPKHTLYMAAKREKLSGKIRNMNTFTTSFII